MYRFQTGNGQFGGIGNGTWAHAPSPVKVKTISGLSEYNDATGRVEPIRIREISAGNAHIAIVLVSASSGDQQQVSLPFIVTHPCVCRTTPSSKPAGSSSVETCLCGVTTCTTSSGQANVQTCPLHNTSHRCLTPGWSRLPNRLKTRSLSNKRRSSKVGRRVRCLIQGCNVSERTAESQRCDLRLYSVFMSRVNPFH